MNLTDILLEAFIVVIGVVSLFSNLLVLLCFSQSAEVRAQVPGIFILNLSFSNILTSIINMPATFLGLATKESPFGHYFCWAVSFVDTFLTTNTMLSMAALSIDRWIAVVFPLTYSSKMRFRDALVIVVYSWLQSLAFSLSALLMSWGGYSDTYASCTICLSGGQSGEAEFAAFAVFTVVFHGTSFALCLCVLCFTYLKVLRVARFHCKRIDVITVQTLLLMVDIHPSVKQRCLLEQKRRKQRATKKISIFIGSYVLCYAPYVITRLTELLPHVRIDRRWGIATKCLFYGKGACDPFVYSLLRQQYRKVLANVTHRVLRRDQYTSPGQSTSSTFDTDHEGNIPQPIQLGYMKQVQNFRPTNDK
ncbi:G-protein coupled receptor 26 [Osmerus mordax]|uniref:G-protein coupled receptor 26 n=1 Tax=Osmerus mordax TaxID=8014 RepID=UPI00350E9575